MSNGGQLNLTTVAMILGTIAMLAAGQVLFKFAAGSLDFSKPRSLLSWPLFAALAVYGLATLAWLAVLARVPLSLAFPFYGLAFLLVPMLSVLILGEKLRYSTLLGGAIIMIGVVVSAREW